MRIQEIITETSFPRVFYRGTKLGSTKRIKTGEPDWDRFLFVSSNRDAALMYGDQIATYRAKSDAKILYQGTRAFTSLAKGLFKPGTRMLPDCAEVMRRAEQAGYDAVWFKMQGDLGTVVIHPEAFEIVDNLQESLAKPLAYTWIEQTARVHLATFEIDDISYWVKMYETAGRMPPNDDVERMWVMNFGVDAETSKKLHGHQYAIMKPTGLNRQSHRVLSTVLAAFDEFVSHVKPPMIFFSDTDHLKQRARLYQKFAQHLIDKFHYHFDEPIMRHFIEQPIWCLRSADSEAD